MIIFCVKKIPKLSKLCFLKIVQTCQAEVKLNWTFCVRTISSYCVWRLLMLRIKCLIYCPQKEIYTVILFSVITLNNVLCKRWSKFLAFLTGYALQLKLKCEYYLNANPFPSLLICTYPSWLSIQDTMNVIMYQNQAGITNGKYINAMHCSQEWYNSRKCFNISCLVDK